MKMLLVVQVGSQRRIFLRKKTTFYDFFAVLPIRLVALMAPVGHTN